MKTIKSMVGTVVTLLVSGAAIVIGYNAGSTIWENGLGARVAEKSQKVFSKKEED